MKRAMIYLQYGNPLFAFREVRGERRDKTTAAIEYAG